MEVCPSCFNDTLTTHASQGLAVCTGCSPVFCIECYYGARHCCAFFQDTPPVPEENWKCAEEYMVSHPDANERVVRSGPRRKCAVIRLSDELFRQVTFNGFITQEIRCENK